MVTLGDKYNCIVWDFDNVLFYNPENRYDDEYLTVDRVTDMDRLPVEFYNRHKNILLTGRGRFQANIIKRILREKGYEFDKYIFFMDNREDYPDYNPHITLFEYYVRYWRFKIKNILLLKMFYEKILVIDDDKIIIDYCKKNEINCIKFDVRTIIR